MLGAPSHSGVYSYWVILVHLSYKVQALGHLNSNDKVSLMLVKD